MSRDLLDLVRELNTLNDDNLADRVIANSDVQWCLSELQDILEEMPTLTPPNESLTLEQLREMDGEPVWVEEVEHWALIDIEKSGQWAGIPFAVWAENGANFTYNIERRELHCFCRPPEGGIAR